MQENLTQEFSVRLKNLRKRNKWTQQELASKIGVTKETLYRYEKNQLPPSYDSAVRLADLFQVSIDYLMGWTDYPTSKDMKEKEKIEEKIRLLKKEQRKKLFEILKSWIYGEIFV